MEARVRSALVAVACERYRLTKKEWPAALETLAKEKLLDSIPADPFDNQPLRYRRTKDGIVVYSVGVDLKDDGGKIQHDRPHEHGFDVGFPPVAEPGRVVVFGFRLEPHVERLVHDQHPEPVARREHGLAHGVVGAANGVEAGRPQQFDASLFGPFDRGGTQHTVVVVHAGAAEEDRLPVDPQPPLRVERQ